MLLSIVWKNSKDKVGAARKLLELNGQCLINIAKKHMYACVIRSRAWFFEIET